jgi:hypothetical protein
MTDQAKTNKIAEACATLCEDAGYPSMAADIQDLLMAPVPESEQEGPMITKHTPGPSQVQAINEPPPKSWDDYERGCLLTFNGGFSETGEVDAFRHGMRTVFNLLREEFPAAHVCKAAPDMLKALYDLVAANNCNYERETMRRSGLFNEGRKALAKATGDNKWTERMDDVE